MKWKDDESFWKYQYNLTNDWSPDLHVGDKRPACRSNSLRMPSIKWPATAASDASGPALWSLPLSLSHLHLFMISRKCTISSTERTERICRWLVLQRTWEVWTVPDIASLSNPKILWVEVIPYAGKLQTEEPKHLNGMLPEGTWNPKQRWRFHRYGWCLLRKAIEKQATATVETCFHSTLWNQNRFFPIPCKPSLRWQPMLSMIKLQSPFTSAFLRTPRLKSLT